MVSATRLGNEIVASESGEAPFGNAASIVRLAGGGFMMFWTESTAKDGSGSCCIGRIFNADGNPTGPEFIVNTTTNLGQGLPRGTVLLDGTIMVTWQDPSLQGGDTSSSGIKGQILSMAGAKIGGEFLVNTTTTGAQSAPYNALLDNGNVMILWTDASATGGDTAGQAIRGQIVTATGVKVGAEFLVNTQTAGNQNNVHVAKNAGGNLLVTWVDASGTLGDASGTSIKGQLLDQTGAKVGGEFLVNTNTGGAQNAVDVVALGNGTFVVTWQDASQTLGDTDGTSIKAQLIDATGAKIGTEFLVNSTLLYAQTNPAVALLEDGKFVITWRDAGPTGGAPYQVTAGQIFNLDGTRVGDQFVTSTPMDTLIEGNPAVAATGDGRFVVVSSSSLLVGSTQVSRGLTLQMFEQLHQVIGTASGETLNGTAGADYIDGQDGNDTIYGLGGNDIIYGGNGNDTIDGGTGENTVLGGDGNDTITAANSSGTIDGEGDDDRITVTGAFNGVVGGGDGNDIIVVNTTAGTIAVDGGGGANTITATVGNAVNLVINTLSYDSEGDVVSITGGTTEAEVYLGRGDTLRMIGTNNAFVAADTGRQTITPGTGGGSLSITNFFNAGEAGDVIDLSVFGSNPFGPGGPLTIANSTVNSPLSTVITNTATGLTIEIFGVDARNLSSFNLGGVANPLYAPQDLILDSPNPNDASGEEYLIGADGNDLIRGYAGTDELLGGGGNDRLEGGDGYDTLVGGTGADILLGGADDDTLFSRAEAYVLPSAFYAPNEFAPPAIDSGTERDELYGGDGSDRLYAGYGDVVSGGADGAFGDTLYISFLAAPGGITFDGGLATQTIGGGTISGIENIGFVQGSDYADTINGRSLGLDTLEGTLAGMGGNDRLIAGQYSRDLFGGDGDDVVDGRSGQSLRGLFGDNGNDTIYLGSTSSVLVQGGAGDDIVYGGTGNDRIEGNADNDTLFGDAGNDQLIGGTGADTMDGGTGDDTFVVDNTGDVVIERAGEGTDTVNASISYVLGANVENLTLTGTADIDGAGNAGNNVITGNAGSNRLSGGGGTDTLIGGAGDDFYVVDSADDVVVEAAGQGYDTLKASVSYTLAAGVSIENLRLIGSDNLSITGNAFSQAVVGNAGDNVLDGGGGGDRLKGGYGNDTYIIRDAADVVVEVSDSGTNDIVKAAVSYTLGANAWAEVLRTIDDAAATAINLTGNDHTTSIIGNAGANVLTGGAGAETIAGLGGNDTLYGGGGADVFVFASGTGQDSVGDFVSGSDRIDLSAAGFTSFAQVQAAMSDVGGSAVIALGGGSSVTLTGVLSAQVQSGDVIVGSGGASVFVQDAGVGIGVSGWGGGGDGAPAMHLLLNEFVIA